MRSKRLTQGILAGSVEKLGLILTAAKVSCAAMQAVDQRAAGTRVRRLHSGNWGGAQGLGGE